jgi:hypothetical protein
VIRLLDGTRAYLHAVIDNFSRRILAWRVADTFAPVNSVAVLLEATRGATRSTTAPVVLADAGVENVNAQVDALIETGILRRLLAFTELKFSNSMIEAWWRSLKHQWLIGISCFLSFVSCVTAWPTISWRSSTATCTLYAWTKPSGPFMICHSGSVKLYCALGSGFADSAGLPPAAASSFARASSARLASRIRCNRLSRARINEVHAQAIGWLQLLRPTPALREASFHRAIIQEGHASDLSDELNRLIEPHVSQADCTTLSILGQSGESSDARKRQRQIGCI